MKYCENKVTDLKIAYIGGGSRGWAWGLMSDLAAAEDISGEVALYDIDYVAAKNNEIIGNKYKFNDTLINIDTHEKKDAEDFGLIGADLKGPWDGNRKIWEGLKALGVDSIFVGHEHCNSASVVYQGVRLQFGQKTGTYDRINYQRVNGMIYGSYPPAGGTPLVGGTVIPLSQEDGSIQNPYIYLCKAE